MHLRSLHRVFVSLALVPVVAGSAPAATEGAAPALHPVAASASVTLPVTPPASLPVAAADAPRRDAVAEADLWSSIDADLQLGLENLVEAQGLRDDVRDGRLALVVADVTDADAPRVAAVNGDRMMYAASLPKVAILLGAMDRMQSGATPGPALERDIEQMIRYSSNPAATRVLEWVGRDELLALLQSPRLRLYDPQHNGGLWVGKDYGGNPAYRRDPLHNLSHGATAMQVARLYALLDSGRLLDAERTARMKSVLGNPGIHHKFVKGLASRPGVSIYRKSGTWQQFHADGALVESGGRRLVLVGLAEDASGGEWLARIAAPLHDLVLAREEPGPAQVAGSTAR